MTEANTKPSASSRKLHPADELSFTRIRPKAEWKGTKLTPRCWWSVTPSGDYAEECEVGSAMALEYFDYCERPDGGNCLAHIVADMPRELSGIEIGFLAIIDAAAKAGRNNGRNTARYWQRSAIETSNQVGA